MPLFSPENLIHRRAMMQTGTLSLAPFALRQLLAKEQASGKSAHVQLPMRAKSVIFMTMIGGPSQLDLFDPKPEVDRRQGEPLPPSILKQLTFAQIQDKNPKLLGTSWKFARYGETGSPISELMPHLSTIVDRLTFVKTMKTDDTNHMFAELLLNTGWRRFGRPSLGSWVVYGLGSMTDHMPAFMVLRSGMRPRSKAANYGNGFLPSQFQGTTLRSSGAPILNLDRPAEISVTEQRRTVKTINQLNRLNFDRTGDPEVSARIDSYETAFRMQAAARNWLDVQQESLATLRLYGINNPQQSSYARNCLLARRLVERGVRFVQLFHGDWDHHTNIKGGLPSQCKIVDQASSALVKDLAQRGLLEDTIVVWGGELGRTPVAQVSDKPDIAVGRDHQIEAFTMWFAGGGIRQGTTLGETNDLGCLPTERSFHIHDLHATLLHLLGMDHERLTYRYQGRDFRLTDIHGNVIHDMIA